MAFPHKTHSDDLIHAVGQAVLAGSTVPAIVRDLAAGTFHDFGPYELPIPTARKYGQQAKKAAAAEAATAGLTTRATGDLDEAITAMARELLSEYDHELAAVRAKKTRDLEKLGVIVKGLKDLRGLIVANKTTGNAFKQAPKARDPFAAALEQATKPQTTRAMPSKPQKEKTDDGPSPTSQREDMETPNPNDTTIEVLSPAAPAWPLHGRSNVVA